MLERAIAALKANEAAALKAFNDEKNKDLKPQASNTRTSGSQITDWTRAYAVVNYQQAVEPTGLAAAMGRLAEVTRG